MSIEILDPRSSTRSIAPRRTGAGLSSLAGAPIAVIDNSKPRFDVFVNALTDEMHARYGSVSGLRFAKPVAGHLAPEEWFRGIEEQGGAAITGMGDCGACSTYSFLDAGELVSRGVPVFVVISEAFVTLTDMLGRLHGLEHVPRLVVPHPPTQFNDDELISLARSKAPEAAELLRIDTSLATSAPGQNTVGSRS